MGLRGWDILVLNAGTTADPAPISETKLADWWRVYEVDPPFPSLPYLMPSPRYFACPRIPLNRPITQICQLSLTFPTKTNVKGAVLCIQTFLPVRNRSSSASTSIIGINAGMVQVPAGVGPASGASAYTSSKIAQLKVMEFLAAENPEVFVASVHPGVVLTPLARSLVEQYGDAKSGKKEGEGVPLDDGE